jgi:hypothetical protein
MNVWTIVWLVVYAVAALLFFGTALVITFVGFHDLRDLLSRTVKSTPASPSPEQPPRSQHS